ncbi:MAG: hypothetical protein PHY90_11590 [Desulfitobacteriaceae bacterium]|nr:hypothetical protein [Desulfitobacteriaceae bacterium]
MRNKNYKSILIFMLSLMLVFTTVGPTFAVEKEPCFDQSKDAQRYQILFAELEKLIQVKDNAYVLELHSDDLKKIGLTEIEYKNIKEGLNATNKYISDNSLSIQTDLTITNPNGELVTVRAGLNEWVWTWYGWDVYLDNDSTRNVINRLENAQPVFAIGIYVGSKIPGTVGVVVTEVSVWGELMVTIGKNALNQNNHGNGIKIKLYEYNHIPIPSGFLVPFSIEPQ